MVGCDGVGNIHRVHQGVGPVIHGHRQSLDRHLLLDLGNDYTVTCGQLKEITAVQGEYLEAGQLLGYVAEPTKYYTIEGSNIFLEMRHGDKTVDPLDYLE